MKTSWIVPVIAAAALVAAAADSPPAPPIADGTYYGYEYNGWMSASDPEGEWYAAHVMTIRGDVVVDRTYPLIVREDGEVFTSASDGGFYDYAGTIETVGPRTIFRMRLMTCDYCGVAEGAFERVDEYIARVRGPREFEVNRILYKPEPDPRFERGR